MPDDTLISGNTLLFRIVLLVALPFLLASGLHLADWRPAGTVNRGQLIHPPTPLTPAHAWTGTWSLVLVHDAPCHLSCTARLDALRRVRTAMGKGMTRTRLVWLGQGIVPEAVALRRRMPDLVAFEPARGSLPAVPPGSVLLVDPAGQAMLRYAPGAPAEDVQRDLQRLLATVWRA